MFSLGVYRANDGVCYDIIVVIRNTSGEQVGLFQDSYNINTDRGERVLWVSDRATLEFAHSRGLYGIDEEIINPADAQNQDWAESKNLEWWEGAGATDWLAEHKKIKRWR